MAKSTKRIKSDAAAWPVPQSNDEANASIERIGKLRRELARREADMNDEIARSKSHYEANAKHIKDELKGHLEGVQAFCESRRAELTETGKRKSYRFAAGVVRWALTPPVIKLRDVAAVVERIQARKAWARRFLRVKTEVNKEALLDHPKIVEQIDGVTIGQKEEFSVEPFEGRMEEAGS